MTKPKNHIETKKRFGLKESYIQKIQKVFSHFSSITQVLLYGSRAKGNYRPGSDIDLTIKTKAEPESSLLFDVIGELDDLDLAYGFDVSIFDRIDNENLIDHINRVGLEFYNADLFAKQQAQK